MKRKSKTKQRFVDPIERRLMRGEAPLVARLDRLEASFKQILTLFEKRKRAESRKRAAVDSR